ncbi:helix-turn-helix domain-containing protein [Desulfovibrio sp. SGI.169]|uniref:helix-turn-helix domain-containing protein n=1 Tax=Desulfovibrio sp. SGI.169 TaxID=3420561 RepID=UPI003D092E4E
MSLEELGAALRAEREKRGLSIEDVANHLKIGVRLLRALEEGDAASLPHLAYAKGFIRSYGFYLGMAAEEINEAVCALGGASPATTPQAVYEPEESLARPRGLKWLGALVVLALLGGGAYVAWQQGVLEILSRQTRRLAQPSPPLQTPDSVETMPGRDASPAAVPPAAPVQPPSPSAASASSPVSAPAPSAVAPADAARASALASAGVARNATAPTAREQENMAAGNATWPAESVRSAEGAPPPGQHKVIITATEECWIHSNADNTDTRQFSLRKGDTFALTFTKGLELKLGNAGGVRIRYNGRDMPAPGQSGQVRTLTFPPAARQ